MALTSLTKPNEEQLVRDLASVMQRHGVPMGSTRTATELAAQLQMSPALRGDLFSLCTAISHMGEQDLTAEQLLELVSRAAGSAEGDAGDLLRETFLAEYAAWSNRPFEPPAAPASNGPAGPDDAIWRMPVSRLSAALADVRDAAEAGTRTDWRPAGRRTVSAETPIGDLTVSELRSYLDELESRVGRLRPFLNRAGETTDSRWTEPEAFATLQAEYEDEEFAADGMAESHDEAAEESAVELANETSAEIIAAAVIETSDDHAEAVAAPRLQLRYAAITARPESAADADRAAAGSADGTERVDVLPLRGRSGSTQVALFGSMTEPERTKGRAGIWLTAAALVLAGAAGFGYHWLHRPPVVLAPAVAPALEIPPATPAEQSPAPDGTVVQPAPPGNMSPAVTPAVGAANSPRIPSRAVQMEAAAARAERARRQYNTQQADPPAPVVRQPAPSPGDLPE